MLPISVCIIVKNEALRLKRCLDSLASYPFEIVVIDTGSTDETKEIALAFTDKVFDFEWCDDFSAARNYSLQMGTNDWIFVLDSDEAVENIDLQELDYFQKNFPHAAGSVSRSNSVGDIDHPSTTIDRTERFFNRNFYTYTGRIHEQLTPKSGAEIEAFLLKISLFHDGYLMSEEQRLAKAKRNLSLLQSQQQEESESPYLCYQLGKAHEILSEFDEVCDYMRKGLTYHPEPSLAYTQAMILSYGNALLATNRNQEALALIGDWYSTQDTADFHYLCGLVNKKNERYQEAVDEFLKAASYDFANQVGANTYLALYQTGSILMLAADFDKALYFFRLCGDYEPALRAIQMIEDAMKGVL